MRSTVLFLGWLLGAIACVSAHADTKRDEGVESVKHLDDFQVIELRRYNVKSGEREHFVQYFDAYFPEAFEQLGSMVFGQFYDRSAETHFTWLRGFKDISARPIVEAAFYYGPVWREHRVAVNALFPDAPDNVLLLRPLTREQAITVLPSVDPVKEPHGAHGIVVAQIFAINKGSEAAFAERASGIFASYRAAGLQEAGELVSLDVQNNFPQLPIRSDGPFFVWLGIAQDEQMVKRFSAAANKGQPSLIDSGLLRGQSETLVLDPTPRSRLRWWDSD
jgi:hypothetical protein